MTNRIIWFNVFLVVAILLQLVEQCCGFIAYSICVNFIRANDKAMSCRLVRSRHADTSCGMVPMFSWFFHASSHVRIWAPDDRSIATFFCTLNPLYMKTPHFSSAHLSALCTLREFSVTMPVTCDVVVCFGVAEG
eukprot:Gb_38705 [translate_table: standard]